MSINFHIRPRIGYSPLTILTGLKPTTLLSTLFIPNTSQIIEIPVTADKITELITSMVSDLDKIHKHVDEQTVKIRKQRQQTRSKHRRIQPINFSIGDYVLVASNIKRTPPKTMVTWLGPAQIIDTINDYIYCVKFILSDKEEVHAQRLKFYSDSSLNITSDLLDNIGLTDSTFFPQQILDHRVNPDTGESELLIHWKGFELQDAEWEPLTTMQEDIPDMVNAYYSSLQ